jgi:hypothetical protein
MDQEIFQYFGFGLSDFSVELLAVQLGKFVKTGLD